MGLFGKRFDLDKTKVHLKLAVGRVRLVKNKKSNQQKVARKEIAALLLQRKEESARIRVEHVIREDCMLEALELVELFAELLLARIHCLSESELREEIKEAVCSLIYVANKVDVEELREVREQLIAKYGKDFGEACERNSNNCVSARLYSRVNYRTPEMFRVLQYLGDIAAEEKIQWQPPAELIQAIESPQGSHAASGQITVQYPTGPFAAPAAAPSTGPGFAGPPGTAQPPVPPPHMYVGGEPPVPGPAPQGPPSGHFNPPSYGAPASAPSAGPGHAPSAPPPVAPGPRDSSPSPPPPQAPPPADAPPAAAPDAPADPSAPLPGESEDDYLMRRLEALKNKR
eukprot:tig00000227_g19813.t1